MAVLGRLAGRMALVILHSQTALFADEQDVFSRRCVLHLHSVAFSGTGHFRAAKKGRKNADRFPDSLHFRTCFAEAAGREADNSLQGMLHQRRASIYE